MSLVPSTAPVNSATQNASECEALSRKSRLSQDSQGGEPGTTNPAAPAALATPLATASELVNNALLSGSEGGFRTCGSERLDAPGSANTVETGSNVTHDDTPSLPTDVAGLLQALDAALGAGDVARARSVAAALQVASSPSSPVLRLVK